MNVSQKGERRNPLVYLFGKTWLYSAGNRSSIVKYWLMFIIGNAFDMIIQPLVFAKVMDTIQKEGVTGANLSLICRLLLVTLAIDILFWAFHGPARVMERCNAFKAKANYKRHLLRGVLTLPLDWHSEHLSGDTIDKIDKGTESLRNFASESFLIIQSTVQMLVCYSMLTYFSPSAGLIVIAMMALTFWITSRFDRILISEYKRLNQIENKITAGVFDAISNITTVVILRVENLVFEALSHKIDSPYELFRKNNIRNESKWFLTNMCCSVMTIIVLSVYFLVNVDSAKGIMIGNVYLLFKYLDKIGEIFFRFCGMYGDILQRKAKVMNSEELTVDFRPASFGNHVLPDDWKQIHIKNLNFSYENKNESDLNLNGIGMTILRGQKIALVGRTGDGKTTFLKVMRGLYSAQSLDLMVDGRLVEQGFEGIARAIALVPQDPEIFASTIRDNITMGAEQEPSVVNKAIEMSCFRKVCDKLPKGLDSMINEKGVNLSGGERQRLALTRGLLACFQASKSLILLDEPTSSVDVETEKHIYRNIFEAFPMKTIISSIHRLHLLPTFDMVYMFDRGKIVGRGTFTELLEHCPEFQALWGSYKKDEKAIY